MILFVNKQNITKWNHNMELTDDMNFIIKYIEKMKHKRNFTDKMLKKFIREYNKSSALNNITIIDLWSFAQSNDCTLEWALVEISKQHVKNIPILVRMALTRKKFKEKQKKIFEMRKRRL